jgi:RNA polymerase sigma-70 factor (ECF subfamily)
MTPDRLPSRPVDLDDESTAWVRSLAEGSPDRAQAVARLHGILVRGAHAEVSRRRQRIDVTGKELDDLANQAANDALVSILRKVETFRGDSRFTTWAYAFVVFEVSAKIGRHFWQRPSATLDGAQWERLPDRFGLTPQQAAESNELLAALRSAVENELTDRQRTVFLAVVVEGVPLDALVVRWDTNRNAIYKTVFDARRKIRAALVTQGFLGEGSEVLS